MDMNGLYMAWIYDHFVQWEFNYMNKIWTLSFAYILLQVHKDYTVAAQKIKFSIKDFFSKCDQMCRKLQIWSHLLKKSLMENFIFCIAYPSKLGYDLQS